MVVIRAPDSDQIESGAQSSSSVPIFFTSSPQNPGLIFIPLFCSWPPWVVCTATQRAFSLSRTHASHPRHRCHERDARRMCEGGSRGRCTQPLQFFICGELFVYYCCSQYFCPLSPEPPRSVYSICYYLVERRHQWIRRHLDMCPVATFDNSVTNTKRTAAIM